MLTTIAKTWRFDAAHLLPNHQGKCASPHGHTYAVTVGVEGEPAPINGASDEGMVLDFGVLQDVWRQLEPVLDHCDLNQSLRAVCPLTTCEGLAAWLYEEFSNVLDDDEAIRVAFVRVSETPSTYAEVRYA